MQAGSPGNGSVTAAKTGDDWLSARLRGFGPIGVLTTLAVMLLVPILFPLGAAVPLLWAWRSRTPHRELGLARPRSWPATIGFGILSGVAFKILMKSVIMPLLGAPPVNAAFQHLQGNAGALPGMMFNVIVGAGFGEELLYRGFLFLRLGQLLGGSRAAKVVIVLVTALYFGLIHYPGQGLPGAQQAVIMALTLGTLYARTGRLWFLVALHAAFDVAAVLIIYLGFETRLAQLFFR